MDSLRNWDNYRKKRARDAWSLFGFSLDHKLNHIEKVRGTFYHYLVSDYLIRNLNLMNRYLKCQELLNNNPGQGFPEEYNDVHYYNLLELAKKEFIKNFYNINKD